MCVDYKGCERNPLTIFGIDVNIYIPAEQRVDLRSQQYPSLRSRSVKTIVPGRTVTLLSPEKSCPR